VGAIIEAPQPTLNALAKYPQVAVEPDALLAGFDRLARVNSIAAAALLPNLLARPDTSPALQERLRRTVALGAAYDHDPSAVRAFKELNADAGDDSVHEWRARAALWAGDYKQARAWIDEMPPSLAAQPRWRFWRARAVEATSGAGAAALLYAEIADLRDYYGYLAADRAHRSYNLNAKPSPDDLGVQNRTRGRAGLGARACAVRLRNDGRCILGMECGRRPRRARDQSAGRTSGVALGVVRTVDLHAGADR
jgi:soluble lytic murein transglycosylase